MQTYIQSCKHINKDLSNGVKKSLPPVVSDDHHSPDLPTKQHEDQPPTDQAVPLQM